MFLIGIKIDYSLIILFFIGIAIGLLLFGIIFFFIMISTRRNFKYIVKSNENVKEEEINELIQEARLLFFNEDLKNGRSDIVYCKDISIELVKKVAAKFFPKSKNPLCELSVDELLELLLVVSESIDKRLDNSKITRFLKKQNLSFILSMVSGKEEAEISQLHKESASYKAQALGRFFKKIGEKVKGAVINKAMDAFNVIPDICILIIHICGEETYKAFYKKLNKTEASIDTGIDMIQNSIMEGVSNDYEEEE